MSRTYVMILGVYTILCVIVIGLSVGTQYRVYQSHSIMKKMLAETSQRAEAMAAQRDREADIASLSMLLLFDLAHATNISLYQAKRETLLRIEEIIQRREKCYYDDTCYDWIKVALINDSPEYLRETASMLGSEVKSRKSVSKKEYADEIDRLMGHLASVEPSRKSREKQWRDAVEELCLTASKLARHMQPRCMLLDVEPVKSSTEPCAFRFPGTASFRHGSIIVLPISASAPSPAASTTAAYGSPWKKPCAATGLFSTSRRKRTSAPSGRPWIFALFAGCATSSAWGPPRSSWKAEPKAADTWRRLGIVLRDRPSVR